MHKITKREKRSGIKGKERNYEAREYINMYNYVEMASTIWLSFVGS